jgi:uncharacterized protein YdhG (YjbR/CyaY superfamily)
MGTVDDYLLSLQQPAQLVYAQVRDAALAEVPDAEQGTSYGMAALTYRGKPLLGFRAAAAHLSVFPFSPAAIDAVRAELPAAAVSKGTLRFTADAPLPDDVVRRLVRARAEEIRGTGTRR